MSRRARAFTLIELMIVIAILLALCGLTIVVGVLGPSDRLISDSAQGLSASVDEARSIAIKGDWPVCLVAHTSDAGRMQIGVTPWAQRESDEEDAFIESSVEQDDPFTLLYELPRELSIGERGATGTLPHETDQFVRSDPVPMTLLHVYPDGRVSIAETAWVLSFGDRSFTPTIDPWTGQIQFEPVPDAGMDPAFVGLEPESEPL